MLFRLEHDFFEPVGDAEEVRAVDFIHFRVVGNVQVFFRDDCAVGVRGDDFIPEQVDFRGFHDTFDEQQAGQHEAELNGYREVENYGEEKGDEQDGHVSLRVAEQLEESAPTAHVVADDDQHTRQASHGDVLG